MSRRNKRRLSPTKLIAVLALAVFAALAACSPDRSAADTPIEQARPITTPDNFMTKAPSIPSAPSPAESPSGDRPARSRPPRISIDEPQVNAPLQGEAVPIPNTLLVNATNPLSNDYRPAELVNLYAQKGKHFALMEDDIKAERIVYEAMEAMFMAAQSDGVRGFIITSGYRTREEQQALYNSTTTGTAAKPGTSEHETGLAFDVGAKSHEDFGASPQFEWLKAHCAEYGFILRYPLGLEDVTGYPYEPWHYRYVGAKAAAVIMENGITLEQYCEQYE